MTRDSRLHKALEQLERNTRKLDPEQAIALIDNEIAQTDDAEYVPHFEVYKAQVLHGSGQLGDAAQVLIKTAEQHDSVDSVHFFAGQYLLELGRYRQAILHLSRCVEICESSGETWYLDSAYLMRAYCAARSGDAELARRDLTHVGDDEEMFWIAVEPVVSKASINAML
jgi:tetratricopeptide (TPR) repeat protein